MRRACELHALGATQNEAAKAVGISLRTFEEKLRKQPEYRALVENKRSESAGLLKAAVDVLEAGLEAEFHDGDPNYLLRSKSAEAILKNADAISKIEGGASGFEHLEGAFYVLPRRDGTRVEG